jgi:ABC-type bacteriocin/lantibiotic exporter with double-glycine peptidase domain
MADKDWAKLHVFQEKCGWCGPAVIQMILAYSGIRKSQKVIARDVYLNWLGTSQQVLIAYLPRFFKDTGYKNNSTLKDIKIQLKKGNLIIINWWENIDGSEPDGHYSIISDIDEKNRFLTIVDPSYARCGIWNMSIDKFQKRWFDYIDTNKKIKISHLFLWVNPRSKITKKYYHR